MSVIRPPLRRHTISWPNRFESGSRAPLHGQQPPALGPEAIVQLQRQAGNDAVSGLLAGGMMALASLADLAEQLLWKAAASGGEVNENRVTDDLFWMEHPTLRGEKLQPGSPEALRWLHIRDAVVRPLLRSRPAPQGQGQGPAPAAGGAPPGMVRVDQVAAESGGASAGGDKAATTGDKGASTADKYFVQDVGRYKDVDEKDQPRVWAYGSSGMNICNMTSLTMGLVSMAGESEVRSKMIDLLRSKGMHRGASVQVGGKWLPLAEALDDPKVADRITLIDLVTAVAIGQHGVYKDVTVPDTLARVARESGLATGSASVRGQPRLATEKGRALAQEMLASGKRVIAGTINHYVYLIEVRSDGVVVHDPAGARVEPTVTGPVFLHGGTVNSIAYEWSKLDDARRERAVRRVSTNPELAAIVNRLVEIWAGDEGARKAALGALAKEHPGHISTGRLNFYGTVDFSPNDLRLVVSLAQR